MSARTDLRGGYQATGIPTATNGADTVAGFDQRVRGAFLDSNSSWRDGCPVGRPVASLFDPGCKL